MIQDWESKNDSGTEKQVSTLTRLDERGLEHVRQEREHGVERLEVTARGRLAVLDAGEEFSEDREVEDEGRREQRVLGG